MFLDYVVYIYYTTPELRIENYRKSSGNGATPVQRAAREQGEAAREHKGSGRQHGRAKSEHKGAKGDVPSNVVWKPIHLSFHSLLIYPKFGALDGDDVCINLGLYHCWRRYGRMLPNITPAGTLVLALDPHHRGR